MKEKRSLMVSLSGPHSFSNFQLRSMALLAMVVHRLPLQARKRIFVSCTVFMSKCSSVYGTYKSYYYMITDVKI